ncbi:MAG: 3-deoxy-7-phosphoheptulonate synthase [Candidatus Woesearchaeota archaeon]|nr:3-deoxy-7-phosphoheptulonate synthase [Candidatus Woesearchaeota archaeon]
MKVFNTNIVGYEILVKPRELTMELPLSEKAEHVVGEGREIIEAILDGKDKRKLVVVGPCSIHNVEEALEYAQKLKSLADELPNLFIVMRVYFEKPRTTVGWKGLINDPHLDGSFKIEEGMKIARKLLLDINELGLCAGSEALDPISPQYIADLITWYAIGARTTESQTHREMSSGLSAPIGFKNGTNGGVKIAINAMQSASSPHRFLGMNSDGAVSVYITKGNKYGHLILRGGSDGPNYDTKSVAAVQEQTDAKIMIDCSHANSEKNHEKQPGVCKDAVAQMKTNPAIIGLMIESNLGAGNQKIPEDVSTLEKGVSVTDKCIDWETTEELLRWTNAELA